MIGKSKIKPALFFLLVMAALSAKAQDIAGVQLEERAERSNIMITPNCNRIPKTSIQLDGFMEDYLTGITEQWLLIAPKANPAMLEMFRDRDASPLREQVPWAGEFAGKYLTSAVQVLRVTGDPRLRAWLEEFVAILISYQDEDGYLGPWPKKYRLTNRRPTNEQWTDDKTWDTWNHYHIMIGLILWNEETGDKAALKSAEAIADSLCHKYLGPKQPRLVDTYWTEMNLAPVHTFAILYRKTSKERYLKMALQLVDEFEAEENGIPLAGDFLRRALEGKEFFQTQKLDPEFSLTHFNRWESLHSIMAMAELYWITGDEQYRKAFEHLWWSMVKFDRHNNGGFSSGERAQGNPYDFSAIETCCTIAWIAMSVEMLKISGNSVVADELELSTLNSVTGMHSSTGRWSTYNTPMNGVKKSFLTQLNWQAREGGRELGCCPVNSPRGFGAISDWALMKDKDGMILNYYGPSVMTADIEPGLSVTLTQKTEYPIAERIEIGVAPSKVVDLTLKLRIPYWSKKTKVKLNGKVVQDVQPGRYLAINRKWQRGDKIEIDLDFSLHFWIGEKDCQGLVSVYRGPILLTYDHRYNLEYAPKKEAVRYIEKWDQRTCMLEPPELDAKNMEPKLVKWDSWLPPVLLFEVKTADGRTVHLCDFGSAGEVGTPYLSWLPIKNAPEKTPFSRTNLLRTSRF